MKSIVRRIGVSLFLLALVITAAGAASAETPEDDVRFCLWTNHIDTGKDGTYRALLALANVSSVSTTYSVKVFTPGNPPPNGRGTTVTLAPWETRIMDSVMLNTSGVIGIMQVATQAPGFVAATLYTAYQGNLIVQQMFGCWQ
jgi:hypothetical protein